MLNHAVSPYFGTSLDISEKAYDKIFDFNVKSVFFMIKEAKELLMKGNEPNILVNSSITGINPNYTVGVYGMSKAALINMTIFLA